MVVIPDWPTRFAEYVNECSRRRFRWGEWDCLIFTNGAVRVLRGYGFADDMVGYRRNAAALRTQFGANSLPEFMDTRLPRIDSGFISRGSVVAIPMRRIPYYALGIAFGDGAVTLAEIGTNWIGLDMVAAAWRVECV